MKITTTRFGEIEVSEDRLLDFPYGIIGFEDCRRFCLVDFGGPESPFTWLQSVDRGELAFVIVDPTRFFADYSPSIPGHLLSDLGLESLEEAIVAGICVIPGEFRDATINLLAPVLINPVRRLGLQAVLPDQTYSMRQPLFPPQPAKTKKTAEPAVAGGR